VAFRGQSVTWPERARVAGQADPAGGQFRKSAAADGLNRSPATMVPRVRIMLAGPRRAAITVRRQNSSLIGSPLRDATRSR